MNPLNNLFDQIGKLFAEAPSPSPSSEPAPPSAQAPSPQNRLTAEALAAVPTATAGSETAGLRSQQVQELISMIPQLRGLMQILPFLESLVKKLFEPAAPAEPVAQAQPTPVQAPVAQVEAAPAQPAAQAEPVPRTLAA